MLFRRMLPAALLALGLAADWEAVRAEETSFPQEAKDRYQQGVDLQKKGQVQDAIGAFEEAIKLGMDNFPRAHLNQAKSYLALKQYDAAIDRFTKFIDRFSMEDSCRY
ncbi:MAG TPA: tetratricopeptide repeat protein [Gemmataceae bacterium]|jgi:tetratricopeptide (TPR) repeat protein|nr:tetratricopeptide repeat protein [Gemmataceae bacterium]